MSSSHRENFSLLVFFLFLLSPLGTTSSSLEKQNTNDVEVHRIPLYHRGHLRSGDAVVRADGRPWGHPEPSLVMYESDYVRARSTMTTKNRDATTGVDVVANVAMFGALNATFEYFVAVTVGSARQLFLVQADTGSSVLAIPVAGCEQYSKETQKSTGDSCDHANPLFDPSASATWTTVTCSSPSCAKSQKCSSKNECEFQLGYGDGSFVAGTLFRDDVLIGGLTANSVMFGGATIESAGFENRATKLDGILGLAYTSLDAANGESVFEVLATQKKCANKFGMCLGESGGMLQLGGADPTFSDGAMEYTPITQEGFYRVQLSGALVGGKWVYVPPEAFEQRTIVDSGTTLLILTSQLFDAIMPEVERICQTFISPSTICSSTTGMLAGGFCSTMPMSLVSLLPAISFEFPRSNGTGTFRVSIPANKYFFEFAPTKHAPAGGTCMGIQQSTGSLGNIFGDIFMQGFNTEFDRENRRVGFAPVKNCKGPPAVLTLGDGDGQTGAVGHELDSDLSVDVRYLIDGKPMPAGGYVVSWTTSGKVNFGAANNSASVVDSLTGRANVSVIPMEVGKFTITASILVGGEIQEVEFKISATQFLPWELGLLIGAFALVFLCFVGLAVVFYLRRKRRARANLSPVLDLTEDTGDGLVMDTMKNSQAPPLALSLLEDEDGL